MSLSLSTVGKVGIVSVQGLNQPEMRLLAEKVSDQPETWDIEDKLIEFSLTSWQVGSLQ